MNLKLSISVGVILSVIFVVILFNYMPIEFTPLKEQNTPSNTESGENLSNIGKVNFYIDENGTKHYVIDVEDNPNLSD